MPIVRTNPLPPGVYWQDIYPGTDQPAWTNWLAKNKGRVLVRKTTQHDKVIDDTRGRGTWYLFEVKEPVVWEGPGFPTISEQGVKMGAQDAYSAPPPPPDVLSELSKDPLGKVTSVLWGLGAILGVAVFLGIRKRS